MIQNELKSILESAYNIGNIKEISKLEGGYWNQTLKLETDTGEFVLRISRSRTTPESVISQHALMKFMHARIPEIPLPFARRDGATFFVFDNRIVSLLPFMKGEMASRKNSKQQISAARMLAKLHRAALDFPESFARPGYEPMANFNWEENSSWRWTEIKKLLEGGAEELKKRLIAPIGKAAFECIEEIAARRTQIEEERENAKNWISQLKNSNLELTFAPIHGDYYPSNLLTIENRIGPVLDWDECRGEWLAYELGRALWEFCRYDESAVMNAKNAEAFLQAYGDAGGAAEETEFDLLLSFIRIVRVEEILFSLGEALHGEWWEPEYTLYNLEALDNLKSETLFV